jgi:hypothetical protein
MKQMVDGILGQANKEVGPNRLFRYALLVPTVARVHFLNLKALVCILISMGST